MRGDNISTVGVTSVLWRVFSTIEIPSVLQQYMWGDSFSTLGDTFSTVEGYLQYCGGCSVQWGDNISTVGDNISTVGDSFSTVEGIQYIGRKTSVHVGDNISTVGDNTVEGIQYSGGRILISVCLVINNDERDIEVFCITIRNFHSEVSRKFKQISCILRAGLGVLQVQSCFEIIYNFIFAVLLNSTVFVTARDI